MVYGNQEICIVDTYKYLGIDIKPNLKRISSDKGKINSIWETFVTHSNVDFSSKLELFNSVGRSIVCYNSQCWGYIYYE